MTNPGIGRKLAVVGATGGRQITSSGVKEDDLMAAFTGINSVLIFFGGAADESFGHLVLDEVARYKKGGTFAGAELHYLPWDSAAFWSSEAAELVQAQQGKTVGLIGHSYGGHSAYKMAAEAGIKITYLATIDAVSWESKVRWDDKPSRVKNWRNVWVDGIGDYTDVVASAGGHWGKRRGAKNVKAAKGLTHADFAPIFRPLITEVKAAVSATLVA
jgi:pimeloyl-ACP methyl ester carboxylesterase